MARRLTIFNSACVREHGVDMGGDGKVFAQNDEYLVIKYPSHTYSVGYGDREYASPQTVVYKILSDEGLGTYEVERAIDWENKRGG